MTLGYLLRERVNWPTFIVANLVVDVEPALVILLNACSYPLHGYLHTFLAALPAGLTVGLVLFALDERLAPLYNSLALASNRSAAGYVAGGVLGWCTHVAFDSPLYLDIQPFHPCRTNPLYRPESFALVSALCLLLALAGLLLYLFNVSSQRLALGGSAREHH